MLVETKGIVNDNENPKWKTWHEIINNRESLRMETQLKLVNTNKLVADPRVARDNIIVLVNIY